MSRRPTRSDLILGGYEWLAQRGAITAHSRRGRRFGSFGEGSWMSFPPAALFGEQAIHVGADTLIGPYVSLSAGMVPGQELISDRIVTIGDRCIIGRHCSIVAHFGVVIGDDVYFGPNVYITDQNHAVVDRDVPIGRQSAPEAPVTIGAGSWLGVNSVVLPGVTIGRHVAVGAGSVVTKDLPDYAIAVGSPARVLRIQD